MLSPSPRPAARLAVALAAGLTALAASTASAAPAVICDAPRGELGVADILGHQYGGAFAADAGGNFANGTVTAERVAGSGLWSAGAYRATAIARFAGSTQEFGTFGPGGFVPLFDTQGTRFDLTGTADLSSAGDFAFGRRGDLTGTHSSVDAQNADGHQHAVAFLIRGLTDGAASAGRTWVLFWEDLDFAVTPDAPGKKKLEGRANSDSDYNDLAVRVTECLPEPAGDPTPAVVPLPAAVWPGLVVFGAVAATLRKRRARAA